MSKNTFNNSKKTASQLHTPTPAETSGLVYSLATVLPVILSVVFLLIIASAGLDQTEGYTKKDWYLYCSFLLPQIAMGLVAVFSLYYSKTSLKTYVKSQRCHPKYFVIALLLQIGLLCLSELNALFLKMLGTFGYEDSGIFLPSMSGWKLVGVLFTVALLPAVMEEVIFRGILLNGMRSFKTVTAVLLCGGLFSLYHQNPAQTLYQFCCGAAFALVAIKAGSILPTMLSHFINNAAIVLLTKFGLTTFSTPVLIVVVCVSAVCLIGTLWYLICKAKTGEMKEAEEKMREAMNKGEQKRFWLFSAVGIAVCLISWISVLVSGF